MQCACRGYREHGFHRRACYMEIVGAHYAATKAALIGFTRHVADELGPYNVRVNAVAPGRIETPVVQAIGEDANTRWVDQMPLPQLGRPEEVGDLVLYLTLIEPVSLPPSLRRSRRPLMT